MSTILRSGFVAKRAQAKSVLGAQSWKRRFFVLTHHELAYYDRPWDTKRTTPANGAVVKWKISTQHIRGVENVEEGAFSKAQVFQILYDDGTHLDRVETLYLEADVADADRSIWVGALRSAISQFGQVGNLHSKYCPGAFIDGKYSCCNQRVVGGCQNTTPIPRKTYTTFEDDNATPAGLDLGKALNRHLAPALPKPRTSSTGSTLGRSRISSTTSTGSASGFEIQHPFQSKPWFVQGWTSFDTSKKLMSQPPGTFYVRESSSKQNAFTVDIRNTDPAEPIVAKRIYLTEDGFFRFEGDGVTFASMEACLRDCSDYNIIIPEDTSRPKTVRRSESSSSTSDRFRGAVWSESDGPELPRRNSRSPRPVTKFINTKVLASEDEIYGDASMTDDPTNEGAYINWEMASSGGDDSARVTRELLYVEVAREMVAITSTQRQRNAVAPDTSSSGFRATQKLWSERPDVTKAILSKLDKKAIKRQESIFELIYSEEAFLKDVHDLINVYLKPMTENNVMEEKFVKKLMTSTLEMQAVGTAFLNALKQRQSEAVVVENMSDVIAAHLENMATQFYNYCDVSLETREKIVDAKPEVKAFLLSIQQKPEARSLTLDAFSLTPVQRMTRYPLLVHEIWKNTDQNLPESRSIDHTHRQWKDVVKKCNSRMVDIDKWNTLRILHSKINYDRVEDSDPVWDESKPYGYRSIVKRDQLDLVKLNSSKTKISKRKAVEVMLFSDIFLFAKMAKHVKRGTVEFIVYKQAHRSLIKCKQFRTSDSKLQNMIELTIMSGDVEEHRLGLNSALDTIYFKAKDPMSRDRWIESFNPPKEEEDLYHVWECPRFEVVKDWTPPEHDQADSLSLHKGDIVEVEKKGDIYMKGRLKDAPPFALYNTSGYFPSECVIEIESHRKTAREAYKLVQFNR